MCPPSLAEMELATAQSNENCLETAVGVAPFCRSGLAGCSCRALELDRAFCIMLLLACCFELSSIALESLASSQQQVWSLRQGSPSSNGCVCVATFSKTTFRSRSDRAVSLRKGKI